MSKLSEKLQKLKDRRRTASPSSSSSSPSRGLPSFRFSAADEELTEIIDDYVQSSLDSNIRIELKDEVDSNVEPPEKSNEASSLMEDSSTTNTASTSRDISPLKETLLNRFSSKFSSSSATAAGAVSTAPNTSINNGDLQPSSLSVSSAAISGDNTTEQSSAEETRQSSWLNTVKGKLKTVEEKYNEYKNDKEMRKNLMTSNPNIEVAFEDILDLEEENEFEAESIAKSLPHSFSEDSILTTTDTIDADMMAIGRRSSTPLSTEEIVKSNPATPKERRRFTFSFLERNKSNNAGAEQEQDPTSSSTSVPTIIPAVGSTTPTKSSSSLRSRMMERFMGKSPNASSTPIPIDNAGQSLTDGSVTPPLKVEEPFSGLDMSITPPTNATNMSKLESEHEQESDIETAVEADECLTFEPLAGENSDTLTSQLLMDEVVQEEPPAPVSPLAYIQGQWWTLGLPLCLLFFFQLLPLPSWVIGFLTGILIGIPSAVYATYTLLDDNSPRTPFVENVHRKKAKRPAIIVQEELKRLYTWMNLWPSKKGPYDPLTYDVRRTISIRIMLHGPWLEMRFPKRNMPLRRMYNDVEPSNVQFHEHVEVIDLSTCSIDIQPDNLPTKRIWSKKYPIRIRTNTRKPYSTQEATKQMAASTDDFKDEAELKVLNEEDEEEEEEEIMLDAKDNLDCDESEEPKVEATAGNKTMADEASLLAQQSENENKVFYLFTRTAREKEEWFNHLLVAAKFMEDWERQNPKEGAPAPADFSEYETQKVREQKFKMFMEDYPQAKNEDEARSRHEEIKFNPEFLQCAKDQMAFVNIFFGRMWHDLHDNKEFIEFLREKLTRKLLKVKISQYFEDVKVTTLDLGPKLPHILSVSTPWQDDLGTWVDMDIEYQSICQATVQTHGIRLPAKDEPDREAAELLSRQAAVLDSDEEDSAEVQAHNSSYLNHKRNSSIYGSRISLFKEDDDLPEPDDTNGVSGSGGSLTPGSELPPLPGFKARLVEGILRSDFVAKMAESEWVKKNITKKNITLQLQLHSIKGTLRVNFPPAPSDRIWYGFLEPPYLDLALRPCFGGQSLGKYERTISTVMKHLEKRLKLEFIKVLVCPNTDDLVLPFLHHVPYSLTGSNSNIQPTSIYVPKIKPSQSIQSISRSN